MTAATRLRLPLVVIAVLVLQTSLLWRLHIVGVIPDAMLLIAVCAGVSGGSERGAVAGFASGIAIDLYLQTTPLGLSALVFSLVGYGVGVLAAGTVRSAWWLPVLIVAGASAAGEVMFGLSAAVVGQPELVRLHLLVVAGVVALVNAVLAPVGLRLSGWAVGRHTVAA